MENKKRKPKTKRRGLVFLFFFSLFAFLFFHEDSYAQNLEERKKQLEEQKKQSEKEKQQLEKTYTHLEQEKKEYEKILDEWRKKIQHTQQQIMQLEKQIQEKLHRIEQKQKEIVETEKKLEKKKQELEQSVRLMYMQKEQGWLIFLLTSEHLRSFFERFDAMMYISKAQKQLMEEIKRMLEQLESQKQQLEKEKEALEKNRQAMEKEKQKQEQQQQEQLRYLRMIQEKQKELQHEIEQEEKEIEQAERMIEEAIRKIQEERRKKQEERKKRGEKETDLIGSGFQLPMKKGTYYVSSRYGYRIHPITGERKLHGGIDLAAAYGTPIYAADSGTVLYAGKASGFGHWIVIDHNNGYFTVYGHMYENQLYVSPGQQVKKGELIGGVGSDGGSTGYHLHFEIHRGFGNKQNPEQYLSF